MFDFVKSHRIPILFAAISVVFYISFGYNLERSDFLKLSLLYAGLFFLAYKLIQISKDSFWLLAGFGVVFRLLFFTSIPNLSQDFYRFLWDGRLLLQGVSPYLFTPQMYMDATISVGAEIPRAQLLYEGMGALSAGHFSNYPPVNQLFFAVAALFSGKSIVGSVVVLRVIMILADLGILYFGRKLLKVLNLNPNTIFWYFLNPFIIIELTGNLHFEGVMLFFFIWAIYLLHQKKWLWAAVLVGLSISVKLIPLLFLPLLYQYFIKTRGSKASGVLSLVKFYAVVGFTLVLSFAPFLSSEFISNFSGTIGLWFQEFEFNASVHYILRWISFKTIGWNLIGITGKILPIVVLLFVLGLTFFRKNKSTQELITAMVWAISFYLLLSTTVHPWYLATPLLLSVFTQYRFPVVWSLMAVLSYSAYTAEGFQENELLIAIEYAVVIGYAVWEIYFRKTKNAPKKEEFLTS
ncbi:uncharacterized protein DUF2029 [Ulvibacter sp. MAR_2010_11]|uniref:glycosyltransferase 87 family protein n=1 Tax=Ulvibacter sp. MAR_2010_11 TaxID=1250229 RepID=UPI000C2C457E|nr:glycosyltransferase 87 family protein [Ulvibacter sp. MAR_2010_11]PKA82543.1 uncharacterized protein DUF2029 [Ulvibacter sp. MAR_2010_11]